MANIDNSPYTEEQRAEAFRQAVMAEFGKQTRAAEATRNYVGWLLVFAVCGLVAGVILVMLSLAGA